MNTPLPMLAVKNKKNIKNIKTLIIPINIPLLAVKNNWVKGVDCIQHCTKSRKSPVFLDPFPKKNTKIF